MKTLLTTSPEAAAAFLRRGEVVAFPTETVYGLGADVFNEAAIRKIFAAKGRPSDNPLIVHLAALEQLPRVAERVSPAAEALIEAFFPGPLTVILPRRAEVPAVVSGGLPTVGVRMPRHPVAQAFLAACGVPVAAPSANLSGRPSPTTWEAVRADLEGRIPCILVGERAEAGLESTVVDCTGETPVVLRAGVVTLEALRAVAPGIRLAEPDTEALARSPGVRYRHYAPRARVHLVDAPEAAKPDPDAAYIGLDAPPDSDAFGRVRVVTSVEAYAHEIFDFFRQCDAEGIRTIYCQRVPTVGLGLALMDRLRRASEA